MSLHKDFARLKIDQILSETACGCLKEQQSQRPDADQILKRLEIALEFQLKQGTPIVDSRAKKFIKRYQHDLVDSRAKKFITCHQCDLVDLRAKKFITCYQHDPCLTNLDPWIQSSSHQTINLLERSCKVEDALLKGNYFEHLKIPLEDIKLATDNFSERYLIGSGGSGKVYRCKLPNTENDVVIKRFSTASNMHGQQWFFEIKMLAKCKHPNIISLGFCYEGPHRILVFEYASKGSLDNFLGNTDPMNSFTWDQRIQICLDIAHGLKYLHASMDDENMIIHRDIKSENILLDENGKAKIADFRRSVLKAKVSNHEELHDIAGTGVYLDPECMKTGWLKTKCDKYSLGVVLFEVLRGRLAYNIAGRVYLDPEYMKTGRLKTKSDIYSFGVVLFEVLCGRLAYDDIYFADSCGHNPAHCSISIYCVL